MAWNQNIPQATDALSQSQADILANFQALNPIVTAGQLPYVTIPVIGSAPSFGAGTEGLYTLNNATTSKNELYVHRQTVDAATDIPLTASVLSNTAVASSDNGWTYLPSGIILKWGRQNVNSSTAVINFQSISGGPALTRALRTLITPDDSGSAFNFTAGIRSASSTTSFTVYTNNASGTTGIRYLVIGV